MEQDKNIQPDQKSGLEQDEHDKGDRKINKADLPVLNTKDRDLKPTNKISEDIHIKPADEQQFERED